MNDSVKLIVWGTKGGNSVLCSNFQEKEYQSSAIKGTWQDIRGYITFIRAGINFWAVEFTREYKVYTVYISVSEAGGGRAGTYIALNIYIPHSKACDNILELLKRLRDRYVERYIDSETRQMLSRAEDIRDFEDIIKTVELTDKTRRYGPVSAGTGKPSYCYYSDEKELQEYFDQPYRPSFYGQQEVVFIPLEYKGKGYFRLTNSQDTIEIESLKKIEDGYDLRIHSDIKSLKVNGEEKDIKNKNSYGKIYDEDELVIVYERKYYKDFTYTTSISKLKAEGKSFSYAEAINIEAPRYGWTPLTETFSINTLPATPAKFILDFGAGKKFTSKGNNVDVEQEYKGKNFSIYAVSETEHTSLIEKNITVWNNKIEYNDLYKVVFNLERGVGKLTITFRDQTFDCKEGKNSLYCLGYNKNRDKIKVGNQYKVTQTENTFYIERKNEGNHSSTNAYNKTNKNDVDTSLAYHKKDNNTTRLSSINGNMKKGILLLVAGLLLGVILGVLIGRYFVPSNSDAEKDKETTQSEINRLKSDLDIKNDTIHSLNNKISELNKEISKLEEKCEKQEKPISSQNSVRQNTQNTQKQGNKYAKEIELKEKHTVNQLCAMYYKAQTDDYKTLIKRALARKLNPQLIDNGGIGETSINKANEFLKKYEKENITKKRRSVDIGE